MGNKSIIFDFGLLGIDSLDTLEQKTAALVREKQSLAIESRNLKRAFKEEKEAGRDLSGVSKLLSQNLNSQKEVTRELRDLERLRIATGQKNVTVLNKEVGAYRKLSAAEAALAGRKRDLLTQQKLGITLSDKEEKELKEINAQQSLYIKHLKEIDALTGRSNRNVGDYSITWKSLKGSMLSVLGAGGAIAIGITALRKMGEVISAAAETVENFDERVADVSKTTNLAVEDARELSKEVINIDTRTSVDNLLKLATAGGRLGLSRDQIVGFTEEADRLFVALGDSLDGSSEDIALKIGKISSQFGLIEKFGVSEGLNKVGSIFNELGASTEATEQPMIDFTNRLLGIAVGAGFTIDEVASLGATFDAGGQSMEIAATTLQRLLPELAERAVRFSKIADLGTDDTDSLEKYTKLLEEDALGALLAVFKGAQSSRTGLANLLDIMESLDIEAARGTQITSFFANNMDEFAKNLEIASGQLENNTSITEEANKKQSTLAAETENAQRAYERMIISFEDGSGPISQLGKNFQKLKQDVFNLTSEWNNGTISFLDWLGAFTSPSHRAAVAKKIAQDKLQKEGVRNLSEEIRNSITTQDELQEFFKNPTKTNGLRSEYMKLGLSAEDADSRVKNLFETLKKSIAPKGPPGKGNNPVREARELVASLDKQANGYRSLTNQIEILEDALVGVQSKDPEFGVLKGELESVKKRLKEARAAFKKLVDEANKAEKFDQLISKEGLDDLKDFEKQLIEISPGLNTIIRLQKKYKKELENLDGKEYDQLKAKLDVLDEKFEELDGRGFLSGLLDEDLSDDKIKSAKDKAEEAAEFMVESIAGFYEDRSGEAEEAFIKVLQGGDPEKIKEAQKELTRETLQNELSAVREKRAAIIEEGVQTSDKLRELAKEDRDIRRRLGELEIEDVLEKNKKKEDAEKALKDAYFQAGRDIIDTLANVEIASIDRLREKRLANLDEEFKKKIDDAQGNAQLQENLEKQLAKKKEEINKKAAKDRQNVRIKEAIAEAALTTIKLIGQLGFPTGLIIGALQGAVQIGIIKSQKLRRGGKIDSKGNIIGPSHDAGGVMLSPGLEVEGGERRDWDENGDTYIINKESNRTFKPVLDVIYKKAFSGKGRILSDINSHNNFGVKLARRGAVIESRPGGNVPTGILQVVTLNALTSNDLKQAFRDMIPEMKTAVKDGAKSGSAIGSRTGSFNGAKDAALETIEANRDLQDLEKRRIA